MKITKHEHATLRLEDHGETLLIDPGNLTAPLNGVQNLVGVVLTHEHPDHWDATHLRRILDDSPGTPIFAPAGVVHAASDFPLTEVSPGDRIQAGGFALRFFGGVHARIHTSMPLVDNVGVLVDERFYYPGDSYALPDDVAVEVLAAPSGAPWLRVGDVMDFVLAAAPRHAFGTHDMGLSEVGRALHVPRLAWATEQGGGTYHDLRPGDVLEV